MPFWTKVGRRFCRGAEVDVGAADPEIGGAVVLDPLGNVDVCREDDLLPRAGTVGWWRELEVVGIEILKRHVAEQLDDAGSGIGTGDVRVGIYGVAGSDFVSRCGRGRCGEYE